MPTTQNAQWRSTFFSSNKAMLSAMQSASHYITLSEDFFLSNPISRTITGISLFANGSIFGSSFLEVRPATIDNNLLDQRNFRMIVGVPDRFPVNEDLPVPTGIRRTGGDGVAADNTTDSYYCTFFDGIDYGYDTTSGTTHSADITELGNTANVRARFTTEANDGGDRGEWSEVFAFSGQTLTGTTPLPEAPIIVFSPFDADLNFAGTDIDDQVTAYFDFLTANRFASAATLYPVQFTDEVQTEPIVIAASAGTPEATVSLLAPSLFAGGMSGVPSAVVELQKPTVIPRTTASAGEPEAVVNLGAPLITIADSAGAPEVSMELNPGLRINISVSAGEPHANLDMRAPHMSMAAAAGVPVDMVNFKPGPIRILASAGVPRDSVETARLLLLWPRGSAGVPEAVFDLAEAKNIPSINALAFPPEATMNLAPPPMRMSASAGEPNGVLNMLFPRIRIGEVSAGVPVATMNLIGGVNDTIFRFVPDYSILARREVQIQLPRVVNEQPSGRYVLTGIPNGLTYDRETHTLNGTTDAAAGDYEISMQYLD